MQRFWNDVLNFSESLTQSVGEALLADFGKVAGRKKEDGSVVTVADQKADVHIREAIATTFPTHGILTEESEQAIFPGTEWCWVVDPLDGTNNFACGVPLWGISLGLLFEGTPVFGYLHFPILNQNYYGFYCGQDKLATPRGAFLNGEAIPSRRESLGNNELFTVCSRSLGWLKNGFPYKVRILGSSVYEFASIATGRVLGAIVATPKVWDLAGTYPLVQAAGASWHAIGAMPFPLQEGHDYLRDSFPSFVIARTDLEMQFRKYIDLSDH